MPTKLPRITNCQRAAFCGLMIAGLRFSDACAVADISQQRVREVLPPHWITPPPFRHYKSWKGETLEQIRLAYADRNQKAQDIAKRFGLPLGYLHRLVVRHGWPRRRPEQRTKTRLVDALTPEQLRLYNKLRAGGISRPVAFAEVTR